MVVESQKTGKPPIVILGGAENALSVARSLGRRGIKVYCITSDRQEYVKHSRYCELIAFPDTDNLREAYANYLTSDESQHIHGSVLLACSDLGLEILIDKREELAKKYILDIMNIDAQKQLLHKMSTYKAAVRAGVPSPKFWKFESIEEARELAEEVCFPIMIKPDFSYTFYEMYGRKYLLAQDKRELEQQIDRFSNYEKKGILLEYIPGLDSQLCSYYSYIDEMGNPLFHFTKRIIRRYPNNEGAGCCHITDKIEDVKNLSLKLLRNTGLIGVANVEFKRDYRDGQLKLIECNARFTLANCLLEKSGIDLASFVYDRLTGQPGEAPSSYKVGKRLWYPLQDFASYIQMKRAGEITLLEYLKSILHFQTFPVFAWDDPLPSVAGLMRFVGRNANRLVTSLKR